MLYLISIKGAEKFSIRTDDVEEVKLFDGRAEIEYVRFAQIFKHRSASLNITLEVQFKSKEPVITPMVTNDSEVMFSM